MGKPAKEQKLQRGGGSSASSKYEKPGGHGHSNKKVSDSGLGVSNNSGHIKKHKKSTIHHRNKKASSESSRNTSSESSDSDSSSGSRSRSSNSSSSSPSSASIAAAPVAAASSKSSDSKAPRMSSKMSNIKEEIFEQQKRSKWESPEVQHRQRSAERGDYNRERDRNRQHEREEHHRNGDRGGRYDRKRDYESKKVYERGERNRSRDRSGQNRYDDRRFDKRRSSMDREVMRGDNRRERFDDNRRQERRGYSRSRSPRRDRNNDTNRFRGRDDRQQYQQRNNEPNRRRYNNKGNQNDDEKTYEWGKRSPSDANGKKQGDNKDKDEPPIEKEKINFGLSGALTEDTNKVNGIVVKYAEPPEARKPKRRWRLYPFKGETALPTLHIHRQSCFLVGRDRKVVDLAVDHPSCSKQHAALQYRLVPFERDDGSKGKRVRLYVIDLDSANGTFLNNQQIEARKYYELMERDVIKFGFSSREYVLLHENSKDDEEDDDVYVKDEQDEKIEVTKQQQ